MSTLQLFAVALGVLAVALVAPLRVRIHVLAIGLLVTLTLTPWRLSPGESPWHVGISPVDVEPALYWAPLILLIGACLLIVRTRALWWWYAAAVVAFLVVGLVGFWDITPAILSGAAQYTGAAVALIAGSLLYQAQTVHPSLERVLVVTIALIMIVEFVFSAAQLAGIPLSVFRPLDLLMTDGRPIGTFNSPATPGKVAALMQIPLLMALASARGRHRRWVYVGLVFGVLATAITLSRANLVAVVLGIILWIMLAKREEMSSAVKFAAAAAIALLAIPFVGLLIDRSLEEESLGGGRAYLLTVGFDQIARGAFGGVGPNNYVDGVGLVDPVVASGVPVHVSPLLVAGELGVFGAILFFAPLLVVSAWAFSKLRGQDDAGVAGRAFVATLPGIVLIALTGWGMIADTILPLWWLFVGYASGPLVGSRRDRQHLRDVGAWASLPRLRQTAGRERR